VKDQRSRHLAEKVLALVVGVLTENETLEEESMKTNNRRSQNAYYVAGIACYVLVHASSTEEAKAKGEEELEAPAHVVRLATPDEIGLQAFHDRMTRESDANHARRATSNQNSERGLVHHRSSSTSTMHPGMEQLAQLVYSFPIYDRIIGYTLREVEEPAVASFLRGILDARQAKVLAVDSAYQEVIIGYMEEGSPASRAIIDGRLVVIPK
jgi:hypothetical protein